MEYFYPKMDHLFSKSYSTATSVSRLPYNEFEIAASAGRHTHSHTLDNQLSIRP